MTERTPEQREREIEREKMERGLRCVGLVLRASRGKRVKDKKECPTAVQYSRVTFEMDANCWFFLWAHLSLNVPYSRAAGDSLNGAETTRRGDMKSH